MKTIAKRILSLITVVCLAFIGVFTAPTLSTKADDATTATTATLVMDGSELSVGDKVVIAAKDSAVALSTTQNKNNRGQASITKGDNKATWTTTDVQQLTLETGTSEGTFAFNTGSGYLCAASSSSNWLRTEAEKSANSSWKITIATDGTATITAQGTYTRNLLKYNDGNSIFSCYASGQKDVCLYKVVVDTTAPTLSLTLSGNSYTQVGGETLTLTPNTTNADGATVAWTSSNEDVATVSDGVITPVAMGTTKITASITVNGKTISKEQEIKVYPAENSELSIAEAIAVCGLTGTTNSPYTYSTTGVVSSIDTVYSASNDNITVTITDGSNSIKAYRMAGGSDLTTGKTIKIEGNLLNYSGNTPEFAAGCTYTEITNETAAAVQEALNEKSAYMKLAYEYTETTKTVTEKTDTLNYGFTGISGTGYTDWSNKTGTSDAVYAGKSGGTYSSIQLKSEKNSGIVTTTSGGTVKKITVTWNSNTTNGRQLDIYGKNTAYSSASDLYDNSTRGSSIGSITYSGESVVSFENFGDDFEFIGLRSNKNAMYIDSIEITWSVAGEEGAEGGVTQTVLENSNFKIMCAVDATVADIENIDENGYGIRVTAGGKSVDYASTLLTTVVDGETKLLYVVIDLGDIINDVTKLTTEFTVCAYVKVDGITYASTTTRTYSVATMVEYYKGLGYKVDHLCSYLVEKNAITGATTEEAE